MSFIGYKGVYEIARRLAKQLRNPAYNRNLSRYATLPYTDAWYGEDAFKYIKEAGGETHA
jgi:nitrogenase molybdenum-iron protein alpha chain